MSNLTIQIPEEKLQQLEELAQRQGITLEQLLQAKIDDWLTENKPDFNQVAKYVLTQNTEPYQHLDPQNSINNTQDRQEFMKLPLEERQRILKEQAKALENYYKEDSQWKDWINLEVGDIYNYES